VIHLADCILEHPDPLASTEHGRHVLRIIETVAESACLGQRFSFQATCR
jgi:hypothetical protein